MYTQFMDLVEANRQRDHERRMARKQRAKRALGWTLFGASIALALTKPKTEVTVIKD